MAILQSLTVDDTGNLNLPSGTVANRPTITSTVQSFTTVGTTSWTAPAGVTQVEVLIVAGGAGGASGHAGGGGGAGGLIYNSTVPVVPGTGYVITVGAGGAQNTNGGSSSAFGLTALGGGTGGLEGTRPGVAGGSGGGGSGDGTLANRIAGAGTLGQGLIGGNGIGDNINVAANPYGQGGGGGGAGQKGFDGNALAGGQGGDGLQYSISGTPTYYAGGGGGGGWSATIVAVNGLGGLGGGGGGGGISSGVAGTPNTGGGGGGTNASATRIGGAGGSGIVIVRYSVPTTQSRAVSQTRFNTTTGSIEAYGPNSDWNTASTGADIVTNGLILNLDAARYTSGTAWNDTSGNGNNGTLTGATYDSLNQGAIVFDGIDDIVTAPVNTTSLNGDPSFTVDLWVKRRAGTNIGPGQAIWGIGGTGQGNSVSGWNPTANLIHLDFYDSSRFETTAFYPEDQYVHVCWTKNGAGATTSNIRCFVNGVPVQITNTRSATRTNQFNTSTTGVVLGRLNSDSASFHAPCNVGAFKVYNRALTEEEIRQNYNALASRFNLSPVVKFPIISRGLVYHVDAGNLASYPGAGSTWNDLSGLGAVTTLRNSPESSQRDGGYIVLGNSTRDSITSFTPASLRGNPNLTVSAWVKRTGGDSAGRGIWGIGGAVTNEGICSWWNANTNELAIDVWSSGTFVAAGVDYPLNQWVFMTWQKFAGSMIRSNCILWRNLNRYTGTQLTISRAETGVPNINNQGITLGNINPGHPACTAGWQFGEFFVYDRVLSASEIALNFNVTRGRYGI